ncbi:MAG: sigma-70 family RNA polymerase sigma factor [Pseudomonadota bacterium]
MDAEDLPPDTAHDEDAALMLAYGRGDVQAFERLYARHHAALYRFVRRLLGPAHAAQADEVFQDTWMRVVQSRAQWRCDGGARFRTWLFTLAQRRAIDLWRRSGRETSWEGDDDGPPFEPEGTAWSHWPAPSAALSQDERQFWRAAGQRLLHCLEQLPPAQKAVFLLHHEDGFAVEDAARALELGFETAKSRLRYAMAKLRTCMGAYLPAANAQEGWR